MKPAWTGEDLLLFVGSYLPVSLVAALVARLMPPGWLGPAGPALLGQFLVYLGCIAVIFFLVTLRHEGSAARNLALDLPGRAVPVGLLAGPALAVAAGVLGYLLKAPNVDTPVKDWLSDSRSFLATCVFIGGLAPVAEEIVFRGFFQPWATGRWGRWPGILAVALPFAALHGPTYHWSWAHMIVVAAAGAVFGLARELFASTAAAALLHASYNATLLVGYLKQN